MTAPRVFIADDDINVCTLLGTILKPKQYDVQYAQSVRESLNVLAHSSFDLYLLDYRLQDGTGLEVANYLRGKAHQAPIILISGYCTDDLQPAVKMLNVFRVLKKPFTFQMICTIVGQALEEGSVRQVPSG
jgi:two-component system, NtrC family, response regulator HydG